MKFWHIITMLLIISMLSGGYGCTREAAVSPAPPAVSSPAPAAKPPGPPSAGTVMLKFAVAAPSGTAQTKYLWQDLAREIEQRTEGRVKVEIFAGGVLGSLAEHYDMIKKAVCDMAYFIPSYSPGKFPLSSIAGLPFAFPSGVTGSWPIQRLQRKGYFDKETADVKLLYVTSISPSYIFMVKKKITKLEDVKGLKLRCFGDLQSKALEKLGIGPAFISVTELYTALERGVIDGALSSYAVGQTYRIPDACKYVAEFPINTGETAFAMNKDTFAKLSEKDKKIIEELGWEFGLRYSAWCDETDAAYRPALTKAGIEIFRPSIEEIARWEAATRAVWDEWVIDIEKKGLPGKEILADFNKIRENLGLLWRP